ncbi:aminotransferase class IV [uncultured Fibrella sp.]|uniref:aminotransferase class IV n=1 Tax=uncultured Fibrella sp. TaxID=1284596 RepID=UPI0035C9918E
MPYCGYFNGVIEPVDQIGVGVTDLGLLRGYGLFDYFLTYGGKPFQWDLYWARFQRSAERMNLPLPLTKEQTYPILLDLLARSGEPNVAFRFVMTGGYAPDSISIGTPNLLILSEPIHPVPAWQYERGIRVILNEYVRENAEIKTTDYKRVMLLSGAIQAAGAQDVLYQKDGEISELSRSNIFLVMGNKLVTPSRNILYGITRRTILDLAKADFQIEERPVLLSDLYEADEVFTTSSNKKVLPIVQIDEFQIGDGQVGAVSKQLLARFRAFAGTL